MRKTIFFALVLELLLVGTALAWFAEGHKIVGTIAADDLTPTARSHVAQILGVPDDTPSVEKAMAAASIRPDNEFGKEDKATASWHFIDICVQDNQQDPAARCPQGNCVTAKIDEYKQNEMPMQAGLGPSSEPHFSGAHCELRDRLHSPRRASVPVSAIRSDRPRQPHPKNCRPDGGPTALRSHIRTG